MLLAHTIAGAFSDVRLDGVTASEGDFFVRMGAELGKPTIMVSGDDVTCAQLQELVPLLEVAVVKEALSFEAARHMPAAQARREIADAVERGMARLARGDVHLPDVTPGHVVELDLAPQFAALRPLMLDFGLNAVGELTVRREVDTVADAWEAGVTAAAIVLAHLLAGKAEPDEALIRSLRRR